MLGAVEPSCNIEEEHCDALDELLDENGVGAFRVRNAS